MRPRAQQPGGQQHKADGGVQRHRDVPAHAVQRAASVEVARQRQQRDAAAGQNEPLCGVDPVGCVAVEGDDRDSDEHERQRRIGRHDVLAQLVDEKDAIRPKVPPLAVREEAEESDDDRQPGADLRDLGEVSAHFPAEQEQRGAAQQEAQRRRRVHRHAIGMQQTLERVDVQRPPRQHQHRARDDRSAGQ